MTELMDMYARYFENAAKVRAKASPLAGIWGMGNDPRNDRCHDDFYDAVANWVEAFDGDRAAAKDAVKWILGAAWEYRQDRDVYWYLFAAQKLTLKLIPRLNPADARELFGWYDQCYPKKERLPAQQQVFKALKKAGK